MQTQHLTGPGELIAAIPTMLGEIPHEVVAVVAMTKTGEVVTAVRAHRADLQIPEVARAIGQSIAATLRANSAQRAILVSFTAQDVSLACPAIEALRPWLENAVDVVDAWACDGERYTAPGCADSGCCPPEARLVPASPVNAMARASASAVGHAAPADEDEFAPHSRRRSSARAADRWTARKSGNLGQWRYGSWEHVEKSFALDAPAPVLGKTIAGLQDVRVRDAVIIEWLGGSSCAILDTLYGEDSSEVTALLDAAMSDPHAEPPAARHTVASLRWCRRLIAHARRTEQAPMLALSAVALWWGGDLTAAADCAARALHRDPAYSLALLVSDICAAGVSPAWQREQREHLS